MSTSTIGENIEAIRQKFREKNGREPGNTLFDRWECQEISWEMEAKLESGQTLIDIAEQITRETKYILRQRGGTRHNFILHFTTRAHRAGYQEPDIIEYLKPLSEAEAKEVRDTIRGAEA